MAVAVFIKSESGDSYLNVWDNPTPNVVYGWVRYETDLPSEYLLRTCGDHYHKYDSFFNEIKTAVQEMWDR